MKKKSRYKITLYDESRLVDVGNISGSKLFLAAIAILAVIIILIIGILLAWFTPLKNNLPGYLKADQRSETEEYMLRLDSLKAAYDINQAYLDNIRKVLDTNRIPDDSVNVSRSLAASGLSLDSLISASERESQFVREIQEREKHNIPAVAPIAAEGIRFYPLNNVGVFTENSKTLTEGNVALPERSTVNSISEGRVIEISPLAAGRYAILVQHQNGFLSKLSGTGKPLVAKGTRVQGGQPLALSPQANPHQPGVVTVQMWHNGTPIIPYDYIGFEPTVVIPDLN